MLAALILITDGSCFITFHIPHWYAAWHHAHVVVPHCLSRMHDTKQRVILEELFMSMPVPWKSGIIVSENNGVWLWSGSGETSRLTSFHRHWCRMAAAPALLPPRTGQKHELTRMGRSVSSDLGVSQPWPALHQNYNGDGQWRAGREKVMDL